MPAGVSPCVTILVRAASCVAWAMTWSLLQGLTVRSASPWKTMVGTVRPSPLGRIVPPPPMAAKADGMMGWFNYKDRAKILAPGIKQAVRGVDVVDMGSGSSGPGTLAAGTDGPGCSCYAQGDDGL